MCLDVIGRIPQKLLLNNSLDKDNNNNNEWRNIRKEIKIRTFFIHRFREISSSPFLLIFII